MSIASCLRERPSAVPRACWRTCTHQAARHWRPYLSEDLVLSTAPSVALFASAATQLCVGEFGEAEDHHPVEVSNVGKNVCPTLLCLGAEAADLCDELLSHEGQGTHDGSTVESFSASCISAQISASSSRSSDSSCANLGVRDFQKLRWEGAN